MLICNAEMSGMITEPLCIIMCFIFYPGIKPSVEVNDFGSGDFVMLKIFMTFVVNVVSICLTPSDPLLAIYSYYLTSTSW